MLEMRRTFPVVRSTFNRDLAALLIKMLSILASFLLAASAAAAPMIKRDSSFITMSNGQLMDNGKEFKFASFNTPELLNAPKFEQEDLMRTIGALPGPVARTYTLTIGSGRMVNGCNQFDENLMQIYDQAIASAGAHGVRLIIPIINQDYGSADTDFVGNFNDYVNYCKPGADFWTDSDIRNDFKGLVNMLLTRTNTVTGVQYGQDPTIMIWETGNELQQSVSGQTPAPGEWTADIAAYIKSIAPNQLVMDGSFARSDNTNAYDSTALASPHVDVFSYHFYNGASEFGFYNQSASYVTGYGKAFIAGEWGLYGSEGDYQSFLDTCVYGGSAGCLIWSLRQHNSAGGFSTHSEGNNRYSYHEPGWTPRDGDFDAFEPQISPLIYQYSYYINGQSPAPYPTPAPAPNLIQASGGGLIWQGSAWGQSYKVQTSGDNTNWSDRDSGVLDNLDAGSILYGLGSGDSGTYFRVQAVGVDGQTSDWSNSMQYSG